MKPFKIIFFFILIMVLALLTSKFVDTEKNIWMGFIPLVPLFFNIAVRKVKGFKSYFISKWNFLSSKFNQVRNYDLPLDLAAQSVKESIMNAGFKFIEPDESSKEFFAIAPFSMRSWGENIYVSLTENKGTTTVDMTSVSVIGLYDWEKNEENVVSIMNNIDQTLIS